MADAAATSRRAHGDAPDVGDEGHTSPEGDGLKERDLNSSPGNRDQKKAFLSSKGALRGHKTATRSSESDECSQIFRPLWPQEDLKAIERRIGDHTKATGGDLRDLLENSLMQLRMCETHTQEEAQQALQTLAVYLLNIKHHPESAKFKRIGVHNINFKWKVQSVVGAVDLLVLVGFRLNEKGDCLELVDGQLQADLLSPMIERFQRELHLIFHRTRVSGFLRRKVLEGGPLRDRPVVFSPSSRFNIGFADMTGRRPSMEDQMAIRGVFRGREDEDFVGLFDGHGGNGAADLAAATLFQELWKHITLYREVGTKQAPEDEMVASAVRKSFLSTNDMICQTLNLVNDNSGTTALMAWIVGNKIVVANAGDSRCVLYKESGKVVRLSKDHRPEDAEEKDRIEKLGGRVITLPQDTPRLNGTLSVSRGFGDIGLQPCFSPEPHINIVAIAPEDRYLILACDGLWDDVEDETVGALFTKWRKEIEEKREKHNDAQVRLKRMTSTVSTGGFSPKPTKTTTTTTRSIEAYQLARMLVSCAFTSGSYDNISVIVVQLKE